MTTEKKEDNFESIHFTHEVIMYVPCFQTNDVTPTFVYSMTDATSDEQVAWSMKPDYVLVLKGQFDAKTQPYLRSVRTYNLGIK